MLIEERFSQVLTILSQKSNVVGQLLDQLLLLVQEEVQCVNGFEVLVFSAKANQISDALVNLLFPVKGLCHGFENWHCLGDIWLGNGLDLNASTTTDDKAHGTTSIHANLVGTAPEEHFSAVVALFLTLECGCNALEDIAHLLAEVDQLVELSFDFWGEQVLDLRHFFF